MLDILVEMLQIIHQIRSVCFITLLLPLIPSYLYICQILVPVLNIYNLHIQYGVNFFPLQSF